MSTDRHGFDFQDPLTRPAPAGESAGAVHPLPQGGEGQAIQHSESEPMARFNYRSQPPSGPLLIKEGNHTDSDFWLLTPGS